MHDWSGPVEAGAHRIELRDRGPGWGVVDLLLDGEVVYRAGSLAEARARAELLARALGHGPLREDTPWARQGGRHARTYRDRALTVEAGTLAIQVDGRALAPAHAPRTLAEAKRLAEQAAEDGD